MKINDVEKLLGITKANIRFYEKEHLITPSRTENGYRDYSESDIARLKDIIILRKLGIPVQQIEDILDGALPLQEALNKNIAALQEEIEKLNGSLSLCCQLKREEAMTLDTERYWEIILKSERQGYKFKSLVDDYLKFTEIGYEFFLWPLPGESLRSPWKVCIFFTVMCAFFALWQTFLFDRNFFLAFGMQLLSCVNGFLIWTAIFLPIFFLSRKKPKLADRLMSALLIATPIGIVALIIWIFLKTFGF